MGARFSSSRRPGPAPAPAPPRGDLMASMQRARRPSATPHGSGRPASRSVGAFGLEREIAATKENSRAQAPIRRRGLRTLRAADRRRAPHLMPRGPTFPRCKPSSIGSAAPRAPRFGDATTRTGQRRRRHALARARRARATAAGAPAARTATATGRGHDPRTAQPAPPVEAEVLVDNPIEATLVEEPRPRRSLSKRISDRMRGRL